MAQQKIKPPQNLLDKAIAYVAPRVAAKRMASRMQLALAGGYSGARTDVATLARWGATPGSPDTDIVKDLPTLRARSRDQMRNSGLASGALNQTVTSVVGTGLSHSSQIDYEFLGIDEQAAEEWQNNTNRRFKAWADSTDADVARVLNFFQQQDIFFRSWLESGDAIALTPIVKRAGVPQLALQIIEADMVCNPNRTNSTETLIDGIEIDPLTREPLYMHIAAKHPGNWKQDNKWSKVPVRGPKTGRKNILHGFRTLRPGQVRGVPWIAPILEPLKQISRWSDAELNAAVVSSMFSVFIKMDPDAFQSIYNEDSQGVIVDKAGSWSGEIESGKAVNLLPGESVESPAPGRPNPAFDPFWQAMVRQIGMTLEIPYEVLTMHFQSSYSAARGALLMFWRFVRGRRDALATAFCQPAYELWLENEIAQGHITAPGFFADPVVRAAWCAGVWTGDGPGSIDPEKEVNAAAKRVELGISTKQAESMLHDGGDWEAKHRQRVKEINAEKEDGVFTLPAGVVAVPSPGEIPPEDAFAKVTQEIGNMQSIYQDAFTKVAQQIDSVQSSYRKEMASLQQNIANLFAGHQSNHSHAPVQQSPSPINVSIGVATEQVVAMGEQLAMVAQQTFAEGLKEIREVVENMPIVIPAPSVTVEAIMPEVRSAPPVVHVTNEVQPAQVTVMDNHPVRAVQKVERDANDEIVATVTTYERAEK